MSGAKLGRQHQLLEASEDSEGNQSPCEKASKRPRIGQRDNGLVSLPVELIEHVSLYVIGPYCHAGDLPHFRLTCRQIEFKTRTIFAMKFFRRRSVAWSFNPLDKLIQISQAKHFADAVQRLEVVLPCDYEEFVQELDGDLEYYSDEEKRGNILDQLNACNEDRAKDEYMSKTGTDMEMLTTALRNLRNLKALVVSEPGESGGGFLFQSAPDWTHIASKVLAAVGRSSTRLHELDMAGNLGRKHYPKIAALAACALGLPASNLQAFGSLRKLDVFLNDTNDLHEGGQRLRKRFTCRFLEHVPKLIQLRLAFNNLEETQIIFNDIAASYVCPDLEILVLSGIEFQQDSLIRFLNGRESRLHRFSLFNCDIRRGSWITIFNVLTAFESLKYFRAFQLGQNEKRAEYPGFAYVDMFGPFSWSDKEPENDFVWVKHSKYSTELDSMIDNIQTRLHDLMRCYRVSQTKIRADSLSDWTWG
ncbi:MAG: hypothetical protein M1820_000655 [Bogoriella megaspora]|nr:MAG: hypothetical protein M1820_000655 [Bogoriella megaspora]